MIACSLLVFVVLFGFCVYFISLVYLLFYFIFSIFFSHFFSIVRSSLFSYPSTCLSTFLSAYRFICDLKQNINNVYLFILSCLTCLLVHLNLSSSSILSFFFLLNFFLWFFVCLFVCVCLFLCSFYVLKICRFLRFCFLRLVFFVLSSFLSVQINVKKAKIMKYLH